MLFITKSKLGVFLVVIITIFSLCGCNMLGGRAGQLTKLMNTESSKIYDMSVEIIRCFREDDKEGLKNLFCEKIRNEPDFDNKLSEAFEYLKGDIYSTDSKTSASGGQSTGDGKITEWDVSPEINNIRTSENDINYVYEIYYHWKIVNEDDKSLEGIQVITITLLNIDEFTLGENLESWAK